MSAIVERYHLARERIALRARIADLEQHLGYYLDADAAQRELDLAREALAACDAAIVALDAAAYAGQLGYDLTLADAARLAGLGPRLLARLVERTPAHARPCVDRSTGTARRHLRFDRAQLTQWLTEKPWQADDSTPTDSSAAGGSPTRPPLTLVSGSSDPGSAASPRRAPRSTARKPSAPSARASHGSLPTGDPDLDALL